MKEKDSEKIRQMVRDRYAQAAGEGPCGCQTGTANSCCGSSTNIADSMNHVMGYSNEDLSGVVEGANLGLGCGNPTAIGNLKQGEIVLDLGSGGGFDCFLAAKKVGDKGRVIGVDITPEMLAKARQNAEKMGSKNVEFRLGEIEHLPVADNSADIIMSNCVINLSPDKKAVYREAFRILKPGGRLAISDIVATVPLPEEIRKNLELLAACIGVAATIDDTTEMLDKAGFQNIKITPKDESRKLISQWNPGEKKNSGDHVVSAYIEAVKPF